MFYSDLGGGGEEGGGGGVSAKLFGRPTILPFCSRPPPIIHDQSLRCLSKKITGLKDVFGLILISQT